MTSVDKSGDEATLQGVCVHTHSHPTHTATQADAVPEEEMKQANEPKHHCSTRAFVFQTETLQVSFLT